jgi:hypothetical protein
MNRDGVHGTSAWLVLFVALLLGASAASAQSDPSIRDWGSPPGSPPPWQTPDIYADNDGNGIGNEPGEPSKGLTNRLFARVRNLGSSPANNVTVRFHYAPYGLWSPASWAHFKEIAVVTGVNLAPGAEQLIEVPWDLSNLSENNGGAWGGYTLNEFDHFCVLVRIELAGDANTANNHAQNNFGSVQTVFGEAMSLKFMAANPRRADARGELLLRGIPDSWKLRFEGIQEPKEFMLKGGEQRLITLTLTPPPARSPEDKPLKQHVDVALRLDGEVQGGLSFDVAVDHARPLLFPPSGGVLSPYLVGTWDMRSGRSSVLQLVNPNGRYVYVWVALFNEDEKPLKCLRDKLSPNDLLEVDLRRVLQEGFGVVKVVAFSDDGFQRPVAGVVGYQRHFTKYGFSEAPLHPIPLEILKGDLRLIQAACR